MVLAGGCVFGLLVIALPDLSQPPGHAECGPRALKKCWRRGAETAANDDGKRQSPTQHLGHILDEIERRDIG